MRQTGNCRERDMSMVWTAEDILRKQPRGDIESRSAFHDRVPGEAKAHPSTLISVQDVSAEFGAIPRAFGAREDTHSGRARDVAIRTRQ
jgi:hypothetical protein